MRWARHVAGMGEKKNTYNIDVKYIYAFV